jgi:hypothetical protein
MTTQPPAAPPAHPSVAWRFALTVLLISAALWLGGQAARMAVWSELLQPGTIEVNQDLAPEAERMLYAVLSKISLLLIGSYAVLFLSSIAVLARSPWKLKQNGWLMMCAILYYVFVPVEIFTFILDGKMAYLEFFTAVDLRALREVFLARIGALAGAPMVGLLCYATIVAVAVFQPLKKKERTATL